MTLTHDLNHLEESEGGAALLHTSFFEVAGLGASLSVLHAVVLVWFVPAGENHQPLVGKAEFDVAVEVGAAPQGVAQRRLATAQCLCCQLGAFVPPQSVHLLHSLRPYGEYVTFSNTFTQKHKELYNKRGDTPYLNES